MYDADVERSNYGNDVKRDKTLDMFIGCVTSDPPSKCAALATPRQTHGRALTRHPRNALLQTDSNSSCMSLPTYLACWRPWELSCLPQWALVLQVQHVHRADVASQTTGKATSEKQQIQRLPHLGFQRKQHLESTTVVPLPGIHATPCYQLTAIHAV